MGGNVVQDATEGGGNTTQYPTVGSQQQPTALQHARRRQQHCFLVKCGMATFQGTARATFSIGSFALKFSRQ